MKVGDLVYDTGYGEGWTSPGIVLAILNNVEIPPLVEILWSNGYISRTYADELEVCNEGG